MAILKIGSRVRVGTDPVTGFTPVGEVTAIRFHNKNRGLEYRVHLDVPAFFMPRIKWYKHAQVVCLPAKDQR